MKTADKKPVHILMTANTVGGIWTYAIQLIKAMKPYHVRYTLATMGSPLTAEQRCQIAELDNLTLLESDYKSEWVENDWADTSRAEKWLLELDEYLEPDLIHLNEYAFASLGFHAPKIIVGHSCAYSWWNMVRREAPPDHYRSYYAKVKKALAVADHVVAPSHYMLEELNKYYGSFSKQSVIPNATDPQNFLGEELKSNVIFSIGRLGDEAKNLRVLESVSDKIPWPVFIAGETIEDTDTEGHLSTNKICFLGALKRGEVMKQLGKAAIFVMPAKYEPFGLSVLEAAFSGCALVLGDIPSLRENWKGAAVFVSPHEPEELKEVLNCLISHPSQRKKLAEQASIRAQEFLPQKMAASYNNIYESLISTIQLRKSRKHEDSFILS
jgi:glycogen synthase